MSEKQAVLMQGDVIQAIQAAQQAQTSQTGQPGRMSQAPSDQTAAVEVGATTSSSGEAPAARHEGEPAGIGRRISRKAWALLGFITFGLGAVGVVLPFLPTTPFMLVAAFCFARSSERLNAWFKSTKLYKTCLEGYVQKRTMTVKAKLTILIPVTILLTIGFLMMGRVPVGRVVLVVVWVCHVIYFGFVVKTDRDAA